MLHDSRQRDRALAHVSLAIRALRTANDALEDVSEDAALATISTPVFAGPARVELSFGSGYYQRQEYVQPRVIYEAPPPVDRYQDEDGWRQQQWRENAWRERERREHYWRERQWQEHRGSEYGQQMEHQDRDHRGDWR